MPTSDIEQLHLPSRNVRVDTLVRLRWLSIIGQSLTIVFVQYGLEFALPFWGCFVVIGFAAWLNIALALRFRQAQRLEPDRIALLLAFDILELALLIFLTGGLDNPFSFFLLAPVLISATALPPRFTVALGTFAVASTTLLFFFHYPLPWLPGETLDLPPAYTTAAWLSTVLATFFIGIYAW